MSIRFCAELRDGMVGWLGSGRQLEQWRRACDAPLDFSTSSVFHYSCDEYAQSNVGDSMLPLALRLAFEYFLGRPRWVLRDVRRPTAYRNLAEIDEDGAAVLVGGGGLFYPNNAVSQQNVSGWQWIVHEYHLRAFAPPLFVGGVGWNAFRNDVWPSAAQHDAFDRSLAALLSPVVGHRIVGLRESYSLDAVRRMVGSLTDKALLRKRSDAAARKRITYTSRARRRCYR